ncbi:MAG TPA: delta-60 repeat domain-containing protein [Nitrospira sp.]|nr:delta-60 repeat domain-containing protein [Nitrospira sp.]
MTAVTQRSNGIVRQIVSADDGTGDLYVRADVASGQTQVTNELIRLHADGSVANHFGLGFDGHIHRIALANTGDGALYVSGAFAHFDGQPAPHLVRLTRTGTLDPAFRFAGDFVPGGIAVAEDGSGQLYSVHSGPGPDCRRESSAASDCGYALHIVRLSRDGGVDSAFSTGQGFPGGFPPDANPAWIHALLSNSNGTLTVGGSLLSYNGVGVSSLTRLNADGTLDSTFVSRVGYSSDPVVEVIAPVGDGTRDIYIGGRIGLLRVLESGAFDTSFTAAVPLITLSIAPVQDGTGDLYVSGLGDNRIRFLRLDPRGAVAPTFQEPRLDGEVLTIVPLLDGTKDLYIGGAFTSYNGVAVNHTARVHADGSLAGTLNGPS